MLKDTSVKIIHRMFVVMVALMIAAHIFRLCDGALSQVHAASDGSLSVTRMSKAYTPSGSYVDISFDVKNNTASEVTGVSVIDQTYIINADGDKWTPYEFQYSTRTGVGACPNPVNAAADELGYTIKAGQTATFYMRVYNCADRPVGTYNDFIKLGRLRRELVSSYDPGTDMTTIGWKETIEAEYTNNISVTNIVYNPQNAAVTMGTSSNAGSTITAFPDVIDYGTINLSTAGEDVLSQSTGFFVKNTSPVGDDEHGNPLNITVDFGLKYTGDEYGDYCFGLSNNTFGGMSWAPLPPATDTEFQTASGNLTLDVSEYIAGTYETELVINTVPFAAKVNGSSDNINGSHSIPVKVKLTGINPRLPQRVDDISASSGNNQVELTWTAPKEDISYSVYRREGKETSLNPDAWTTAEWNNYECLSTFGIMAKDDGTYIFVDGTAENGKTYSYVVTAGSPFKGYASIPVSAAPNSVYVSRILASDDVYASEEIDGVGLSWQLNDAYGGRNNNGESMVDHFNIYRDGVLVAQVMQSAVKDTINQGLIDDGNGNSHYGIKGHEYQWETFIETPVTGKAYTFNVSAVSISGLEGYLSEDVPGMGVSETLEIISHTAVYNPYYYEEYDKGISIPAICVSADVISYGDNADRITVWRNEGTTSPDTGAAPYIPYKSEKKSFDDMNVVPGKVYTYTIRVTDYMGEESNYYTFTAKAQDGIVSSTVDVDWRVVDGKKAHMEWSADTYYDYDLEKSIYTAEYKVYRNNQLMKELSGLDSYIYEDDPGADGAYAYRVDKVTGGITVRGRDFSFTRDTSIVDDSTFLKVPGAPSLTVKVTDNKPVLEWKPSAEGGAPSGYHIYRKDAGEYVIGTRAYREAPWYPVEYNKAWGNSRYLTINDPDTAAFVDGVGTYYKNDKFLGSITSVSWTKDECPHEYYITAYNSAGESRPSKIWSFEYTEDAEGNAAAPVSDEIAPPGKPVITGAWVEWEDSSQTTSDLNWDNAIGGRVHVSWRDDAAGGGIDSWNIYTSGTHYTNSDEQHDTVYYSEVINDPGIKTGNKEYSWAYVDAAYGDSGDYGRTVTMKVGAKNVEGESISDGIDVPVTSIPRFRAFAESNSVKLEWTDLFNDDDTTVTGWKIYRKNEYGAWTDIKSFDAGEISYATGSDENGVRNYAYRDETVKNQTTYLYKVAAVCADGIERMSVVRTVTPDILSASEAPGAPSNLKAKVADGNILLTWDAPTSGGAPRYYQIECLYKNDGDSGETEGWTKAGTVDAPALSYFTDELNPGTKTYRVYAYNYINGTEFDGAPSNEVTVNLTQEQIDNRTDQKPAAPVVTAVPGDNRITLNWTYDKTSGTVPVYYKITRYNLMDKTTGNAITISGDGETFTYTDQLVEPGVRYCYEVQSWNSSYATSGKDVYVTALGETKDQAAAAYVSALIGALPEASAVTAADTDKIYAAKEGYDGLTAAQRTLLSSDEISKLNGCVSRLEYIDLYGKYGEVVQSVQNKIDALPEASDVTLENDEIIRAVRETYDNMPPAEAKGAVDTDKLTAAEAKIRELKYSIAAHGNVSVSGKWTIGEEERPTIKAYMYSDELPDDSYKVGFVKDGTSVVQSSVFTSGNYRVVIMGNSPYYGRLIGTEILKVYDVNDILDNAELSGTGEYYYTGKAVAPDFKVRVNGKWLTRDTDYVLGSFYIINADGTASEIDPANIVEKGSYYVDIMASEGGFYTGSCRYEFKITDSPAADPTDPGNLTDPTDPGGETDPRNPNGTADPQNPNGTADPGNQTTTTTVVTKTDTTTRTGDEKEVLGEDGTRIGKGASADAADKAITEAGSDEGPAGSHYAPLTFKSTKQAKNSIKVTWKKITGAKDYVIYGNAAGKKNKMVRLGLATGSSFTVKNIGGKNLKKGTYYKFMLVAVDADNKVVSTSKTVYAATSGGKYCNYKNVTTKAKKNKVAVKVKKTFKLGAKLTRASKKLKVKKYRGISYESSNPSVAAVSSKSVIKGVKKGTCYVYVYTQNGVSKKIKVVVK